jgi:hypothetical protein
MVKVDLPTRYRDAMAENETVCLVCRRGSDDVPLVAFQFRGESLWICPQHLPVLIHDPGRLASVLPGADGLEPAEHHD